MKAIYKNVLGEYIELYNDQPNETKEAIQIVSEIREDEAIQEVMSFLAKQEPVYCTYSHS